MKILLSIMFLLITVKSYSQMEEYHDVVRTKNKTQNQVSEESPVSSIEDRRKTFYTNLLKRLQSKNPKASREEIVQKAEPLWYKYLEIEKNKPKRRPALSNELDVKTTDK